MEFLKGLGLKSRRAFLGISLTATAVVVAFRRINYFKSKPKKTARFLTRDGRLVEVDVTKLPIKQKAVSKQELVSWVWKDKQL